ncbi:hypothetical protein DFQ30_008669 [Apophysomyces sp. BC1015]|nr:hypothetical protein DFQ30_008669 [Apophysomyces sp. BC1015]
MSQLTHDKSDLAEMIHRLKIRLALANFKRQHGYEKYDLYTLESSLLRTKRLSRHALQRKPHHHRYYPTSPQDKDKKSLPNPFTALPTTIRCPLSAKRSTSPRTYVKSISSSSTLSSDDEDAANLLVMLHNNRA